MPYVRTFRRFVLSLMGLVAITVCAHRVMIGVFDVAAVTAVKSIAGAAALVGLVTLMVGACAGLVVFAIGYVQDFGLAECNARDAYVSIPLVASVSCSIVFVAGLLALQPLTRGTIWLLPIATGFASVLVSKELHLKVRWVAAVFGLVEASAFGAFAVGDVPYLGVVIGLLGIACIATLGRYAPHLALTAAAPAQA